MALGLPLLSLNTAGFIVLGFCCLCWCVFQLSSLSYERKKLKEYVMVSRSMDINEQILSGRDSPLDRNQRNATNIRDVSVSS